ncbi:hypothetical protein ABQU74_01775 [Xanthomonas sp. WHRI 10208]|uniref:hypothetical protein n=1 Tax=Xanthomonas TaxID=338 RepID=UPI000AC6A2A0|nr:MULTISPECIES: hypothetical protein [Xanthomonas]MEA9579330.1 hypothetical protein [Xanthomonas nasturtii]
MTSLTPVTVGADARRVGAFHCHPASDASMQAAFGAPFAHADAVCTKLVQCG